MDDHVLAGLSYSAVCAAITNMEDALALMKAIRDRMEYENRTPLTVAWLDQDTVGPAVVDGTIRHIPVEKAGVSP